LRNAVDHGIEPPEARRAKGKPARGVVRLRAGHEGGQVVLQVSDDGAGLDPERVRAVAVSRGFLSSEEASALGEAELLSLVFRPGLTTAPQAGEVSGRGIGLDVVRARVQELRGTVTLESRAGQGTAFTIRMPTPLAIARTLLVKAHQETFALPLAAVQQVLLLEPGEVGQIGSEPVVRLGGRVYRALWLGKALNLSQPADASVRRPPVLILNTGARQAALIVDRVLGGHEIIVRSLDGHATPGVTGATVMGNGSVVPVLDPGALVDEAAGTHPRSAEPAPEDALATVSIR
jgi:two-component system chemotaxis sensor kinase CheA